ncbi:MAG: hypothetical protein F6K24_38150, partial [Okeania sp. SIO2D1]|nr:hypothetical protein [Okeania sp. SIO2D1]
MVIVKPVAILVAGYHKIDTVEPHVGIVFLAGMSFDNVSKFKDVCSGEIGGIEHGDGFDCALLRRHGSFLRVAYLVDESVTGERCQSVSIKTAAVNSRHMFVEEIFAGRYIEGCCILYLNWNSIRDADRKSGGSGK